MGEFWEKITGSISAGSFAPPKWFRRDNLLILVLLGVLLFIIALPVKKEDPASTDTGMEITEQYNAGILTSSGQQNVAQQPHKSLSYAQYLLRKRLTYEKPVLR